MVKVYVEDGQFKVKGTFDFGYIGLYKDDQISVDCDCSDIYDWALICGAYDNLDLRDLSFTDWHNY